MDRILILLGEFDKDKLSELEALARKLGQNKSFGGRENKPRTKIWEKIDSMSRRTSMKDTTFLLKQYNDLKVEISELENRIEKLENKKIKIEQDSVKGSSNVFPYTERKFTIEGYNYLEADKKEERLIRLNNLLSKRKINVKI